MAPPWRVKEVLLLAHPTRGHLINQTTEATAVGRGAVIISPALAARLQRSCVAIACPCPQQCHRNTHRKFLASTRWRCQAISSPSSRRRDLGRRLRLPGFPTAVWPRVTVTVDDDSVVTGCECARDWHFWGNAGDYLLRLDLRAVLLSGWLSLGNF